MIYEHRSYYLLPGKLAEFVAGFEGTPRKVFERHGAKLVGFWTTAIGQNTEVIYILAFQSLAHREQVWAAVDRDEEMLAYRRESAEHPKVQYIVNKILRPASFSPLQ